MAARESWGYCAEATSRPDYELKYIRYVSHSQSSAVSLQGFKKEIIITALFGLCRVDFPFSWLPILKARIIYSTASV